MIFYKSKYKKSILAYIDILGFKKKIDKSLRFNEEEESIYELLRVHHRATQIINRGNDAPSTEMAKLRGTSFSDNVVISIPGINDKVFNSFIHTITYFQWETIITTHF
jgi:hypothetical protein